MAEIKMFPKQPDLEEIAHAVYALPADDHLHQRMAELFWELNREQIKQVMDLALAMHIRDELFKGLLAETTYREAVRIKAEQGDEIARLIQAGAPGDVVIEQWRRQSKSNQQPR